jgi:hypothetical protein
MAKIVVKSEKFGIVVKELDTTNYQDGAVLIWDLLQAAPDADWKLQLVDFGGAGKEHVLDQGVETQRYQRIKKTGNARRIINP